MSLFTKGNWSRFGVAPAEGHEALKGLLGNPRDLFMSSAFVARTLLLGNSEMDTSVGVNPPCWPCGDAPFPLTQVELDRRVHPVVAHQLGDPNNATPWNLPETVEDDLLNEGIQFGPGDRFWGAEEEHFLLADGGNGGDLPVYGFWFVLLKREGLDDLNALKEHAAATSNGQPFRTLVGSSKTDITKALESDGLVDYISRKQFPVIIDFRTGDIWVGTATKSLLDAFSFWMRRHLNINPERMSLKMGGDPGFTSLALNVFRDKDLYALERQEAYEEAQKAKEAEGEEVEEAEEAPTTPVQVEEVPEGFSIVDIATYAAPDSTMIVSVGTDALITLGSKGRAAVGAHHPLDAIALLKEIEGAELAAARLTIKDNIGDAMATVHVDASAFLAEATYRGLDLDFKNESNPVLEEGLGGTLFSGEGDVPRVNNWWMRYYVRLQRAERMIIEALATALEFEDIDAIRPRVARLVETEVQVTKGEESTIRAAVDKLRSNLLPGESVTLATPGAEPLTVAKSVQETEVEA